MYLCSEREERAQRQRREEQNFRNGTTRSSLANRPKQKLSLQHNPVAIFLNDVGLGRYAEVLVGNGFEDIETLLDIEDEHMRELAIPPGHIVKLKKKLRALQETRAYRQVICVPRAPASIRQPDCTANQMTAVQMSWVHVKNLGTDKVGEVFYKKFFLLRPDAKNLFSLSVRARYRDWASGEDEDENDLDNSPALRKLWAKVIDAVGSAVAGLQDVGKLVPMLQQLGVRHFSYGMKEEYFQDASAVLIEVLKEGLKEKFTGEIEQAWVMVYAWMTATMVAGLRSAQAEVDAIQASFARTSRPSSDCASPASISTNASTHASQPKPTSSTTSPFGDKWLIEDVKEQDFDRLPVLLSNLKSSKGLA